MRIFSFLALSTVTCFVYATETPFVVGDSSAPFQQTQYQGNFVTLSDDGRVTITQPRYPKYTGLKNEKYTFKTIGEPIFEDAEDGYSYVYYLADVNSLRTNEDLLDPQEIEAIVTMNNAFEMISEEQVSSQPLSSCGRLRMFFSSQDGKNPTVYHGSASAIDKNLLITAAHNFLPPHLNGNPNHEKVMADRVDFEHLLTNNRSSKKGVHEMHIVAHCFIHPEWQNSFDPAYDIALVFLSESICVTQEEKDRLLQLRVLPESIINTIQVVGYPNGEGSMRNTNGETNNSGYDLSKIVYHNANTLKGSSGSPIIKDGCHIIGVHTRGPSEGQLHNRGVRMRKDLLPFIEESVRINQIFLENEEKAIAEKAKVQERLEEEKAEKYRKEGEAKGIEKGKLETAKNMKEEGFSVETISKLTGLSIDDLKILYQ